ncbi:hypothetical protein LEMLEM_LOCUS26173 [Lemmus lemmus]
MFEELETYFAFTMGSVSWSPKSHPYLVCTQPAFVLHLAQPISSQKSLPWSKSQDALQPTTVLVTRFLLQRVQLETPLSPILPHSKPHPSQKDHQKSRFLLQSTTPCL